MPRPLLLLTLAALAAAPARAQRAPANAQATLNAVSGGLVFAENRGQWPDDVRFRARLGGADLWVTDAALVYDFYVMERDEAAPQAERSAPEREGPAREGPEAARRRGHVVAMRFEGARAQRATGHGRRAAYHNYFLGADPSKWASHVPLYEEVVLEDLYEGVDLRLYADGGLPRYDLVLAPGADLQQVRFRLDGADGVALTPEGSLRMGTSLGPVEQRGLVAYQAGAGGVREGVASAFEVRANGTVGFAAEGADPNRPLVIDPLVWSTFLGGADWDIVGSVAIGADRSAIVAGRTYSTDLPTTSGAYDTSFNGGSGDGFVARLSADGASLLWSTFLGGADYDNAYSVAVDADGIATVAGSTYSSDFPTTPGAFDTSYDGGNAFVARLSGDGTSLLWSTFLGEVGSTVGALAIGADGTATVAGRTFSSDFPTTPGAYDTTFNGHYDAFVARLSADGSALLWSTFLGGMAGDGANAVAVGAGGIATAAGNTVSLNFPATPGAYDTSFNGDSYGDAFVARLSADGASLLWSTFLGGADYDNAYSVAIGADGTVTSAGETSSMEFPTTFGALDTSYNLGYDAFVTRFSSDGSALRWSTLLGGSTNDYGRAVALGVDGSAIVAGPTSSSDFPTTSGAFDASYNGGDQFYGDAFVARLSADGASLLYSTFLGGTDEEFANGVAVSANGSALVVGETESVDFPTTPGAFDTSFNGGSQDGFVAQVNVTLEPLVALTAAALNSPVPRGDRVRFEVTITNHTPSPLSGDLTLDIAGPDGATYFRLLEADRTLGANATRTPEYALPVFDDAALGVYTATVTALEGGVTPLGAAAFTFEVIPATGVVGAASGAGTFGEVEALDGGLGNPGNPASVTARAPGAAAVLAPNPASDRAAVAFALDAPAEVRLALYDVLGREVAVVDAGTLAAGSHRLALDVSSLPAGVYVWRLAASERIETGRLAVTR